MSQERIGPGAGGGKTPTMGMESKTTDGVDSRFTKNDRAGGPTVTGNGSVEQRRSPGLFGSRAPSRARDMRWCRAVRRPPGRFSFPRSRKTALALVSPYRVPDWISGSSSAGAIRALVDQICLTRCEFAGIGRRKPQGGRRRGRHWRRRGRGPGKWCASQSTAALKSRCCKWMTRSMAPPPPAPRFQFMNLGPVTDSTPSGVCHLRWSP